jgi:hypothetical protein
VWCIVNSARLHPARLNPKPVAKSMTPTKL